MTQRDRWASRFGLILAMAGNAIGLGNFLRFPRLAAEHGGGAFMIPYLIALVLLGLPLMWVEWTMGRYGGQFGHSTTPGMFQRIWPSRAAKYFGALGIALPLLFVVYYTYIESWTLSYAWFSATGAYVAEEPIATGTIVQSAEAASPLANVHTNQFLRDYQGVTPAGEREYFQTIWPAVTFWLIAVAANIWIISRGISGGVERLAKIAMPLLFLFAVILVIRVLTLGTPDPARPENSVWVGLNYVWEPNFRALADFNVWLAAAGQIFFTLSIGTGTIQCYASYLRRDDDCALTGLSTTATNEFAEVILGATIAIPISVATFGLMATQAIAKQGSFDLGFVAMPLVFEQMPGGRVFATMWFALLFFAGLTSSVALCNPLVAFLEDECGMRRRTAALICGAVMLVLGLPMVLWLGTGYMDQYDFWVGTFGLVVFSLIEVTVFAWLFGRTAMWNELRRDADLKIPRAYYYVIRYIIPVFLALLLVGWAFQSLDDVILLKGVPSEHVPLQWLSRATIAAVVLACMGLVGIVWRRKAHSGEKP